jgi:quercetin dioxygenase-like cupin family protein
MAAAAGYRVAQLDELPAVPCPCGLARRAFAFSENRAATVHLVEIKQETETHYHKRTTEVYVVLEGEGYVEVDGERVPVKPLTAVWIPPGCRHRAVGQLKILNLPVPPFDASDEWFD